MTVVQVPVGRCCRAFTLVRGPELLKRPVKQPNSEKLIEKTNQELAQNDRSFPQILG